MSANRDRFSFFGLERFFGATTSKRRKSCHGGLIGRPDLVFEVMRKCSFLGVVFKPRILESTNPMTGPQPTR